MVFLKKTNSLRYLIRMKCLFLCDCLYNFLKFTFPLFLFSYSSMEIIKVYIFYFLFEFSLQETFLMIHRKKIFCVTQLSLDRLLKKKIFLYVRDKWISTLL